MNRGGVSDGVEVNQAQTAVVMTRAKRRDIERSKTGNGFTTSGQTVTDCDGLAETPTYEPSSDAEADTDDEEDDNPGTDDINLTDQTAREFGAINVKDGNDDECEHMPKAESETARQFAEAQLNDRGLASYWQRAREGSAEFVIINNLLHKRRGPGGLATSAEYSLVLPESYQRQVLQAAHSHPLAGHFGRNKCLARVSDQFWFPRMKTKISDYLKKCHECQVTASIKTKERAPLQPVHILNAHPFLDISIDVLGGNLPVTARRNKYLLTIVCSNSKWTEAKPMPNCKAQTIADKLVEFFRLPKFRRSFGWTTCPASNPKS